MVVEHEFVTTLEGPEVMGRAARFLANRGFAAAPDAAFQAAVPGHAAGAWSAVEMGRGRKKPARVRRFADLPQVVMAQFDRGRVEVACQVRPWRDKPKDYHTRAAVAMLRAVEQAVAGDEQAAAAEWSAGERFADAQLARARRNYLILLWAILAAVFLPLIGLLVYAITSV